MAGARGATGAVGARGSRGTAPLPPAKPRDAAKPPFEEKDIPYWHDRKFGNRFEDIATEAEEVVKLQRGPAAVPSNDIALIVLPGFCHQTIRIVIHVMSRMSKSISDRNLVTAYIIFVFCQQVIQVLIVLRVI
jgi:hypothetical protein